MKISVIGSGNVGATLAKRIVESNTADVILLDIQKGVAEGKALDLMHAAPAIGHQKKILGTDDYKETAGSNIVVITAGFPRQPGMSRADLVNTNGGIVKEVVKNIRETSPRAIIIVITNPLDVMTYLAYKESGFPRNRVMGMAGVLDASRFTHILATELKVGHREIETIVVGQHGPDMVPLISHTKVSGKPIENVIKKERLDELVKELCAVGARIVNLLGSGSAFYAPSAAAFLMIKAIANDERRLMSVSCLAEGEYDISGVCTGLPVRLGKDGIEEVVILKLTDAELDRLKNSAIKIKEGIS